MAHKGIKTANLPIVLDTKFPEFLYSNPDPLIIGLTIDSEHLLKIRTERLKTLGLPEGAKYASIEQIDKEIEIANQIMEKIQCPVINVSDKSIEESASIIMEILEKRNTPSE